MGNLICKRKSFPFLRLPYEIQWMIIKYLSYDDYQSLLQAIGNPKFYHILENPYICNKTNNIYTCFKNNVCYSKFMHYDMNLEMLCNLTINVIRLLNVYNKNITTLHNIKIKQYINRRKDITYWKTTEQYVIVQSTDTEYDDSMFIGRPISKGFIYPIKNGYVIFIIANNLEIHAIYNKSLQSVIVINKHGKRLNLNLTNAMQMHYRDILNLSYLQI